jgi:hypothetical protein
MEIIIYNYDNIKELNNNEDLIKNVAQKFNDMERMLIYPRLCHNYNTFLLDMIGGTLCRRLEA